MFLKIKADGICGDILIDVSKVSAVCNILYGFRVIVDGQCVEMSIGQGETLIEKMGEWSNIVGEKNGPIELKEV